MTKRTLSLLLILALLLTLLPAASSEEIRIVEPAVANGSCGANLSWKLEGSTLTISGYGCMTDWSDSGYAPWYEVRTQIERVVLERGVNSVGAYAFYDCRRLSGISIPDTVYSFGYQSFRDCVSLTQIEIPDSVSDLGLFGFYGSGLTSVRVPGTVSSVAGCFAFCGDLKTAELGEGVQSLGDWAFRGCTALKTVTLPQSLTEIGAETFRECTSLRELAIPAGVNSIGVWAFRASGLESVSLPEGLTALGERAFENCAALTSLSLPETLTEIAYMSFSGCSALPELEIPASVQKIGAKAFTGCQTLSEISFEGEAPEIGNLAFEGVEAAAYYPAGDASWTADRRSNYGGALSWRACSGAPGPAVRIDGLSTAGAALRWDPSGAEQYELERSDGGAWRSVATLADKSYTDKNLRMGQRYAYRLREERGGVWSAPGAEITLLFNPFGDVPSTGKTLDYVSWAYNNGVVTGTSSTSFSPDKSCTRAQFVMMLWKLAGSPAVDGANPFSDVSGAKTTKAVVWALQRGIINRGSRFDPDGSISRVQIVMILWKMAGSPEVQGANPFTDVSGAKTTKAVLWAYQNGITKGTGASSFSPDKACTRVQLVIFLYKYNALYPLV